MWPLICKGSTSSSPVLRLMDHLLSPASHSTVQQGGNKDKNGLFSLVCPEYNKQSPCHALDKSSSCAAISYDKQCCHCPQRHGTGTHLPQPALWKVSWAYVLAGGGWASPQAGEGTPLKHALVAQGSPPGDAHPIPKGCQKSAGHGHSQLGPTRLPAAEPNPRCPQCLLLLDPPRVQWSQAASPSLPLAWQSCWAPQPPLAQALSCTKQLADVLKTLLICLGKR